MSGSQLGAMLADRRRNAVLGWILAGFLAVVAAGNVLEGDLLWAGFVLGGLALALVPPVAFRTWEVMLPWEVLLVAALPVIGRSLATVQLTGRLATYFSVAALALIVAVELHAFTPVRMTFGFAVGFVVVTTMATASAWTLVRWGVEVVLGVPALYPGLDDHATHVAVNWEFVASSVAGLIAGLVFELYFRRWAPVAGRLPEGIEEFA